MWPDWVSNPGPLTYESGTLPTSLRGPATWSGDFALYLRLYLIDKHHTWGTCSV